MVATLLVSQDDTLLLKDVASKNMYSIVETRLTSHADISILNEVAPRSI